jgi:hypothetical protein
MMKIIRKEVVNKIAVEYENYIHGNINSFTCDSYKVQNFMLIVDSTVFYLNGYGTPCSSVIASVLSLVDSSWVVFRLDIHHCGSMRGLMYTSSLRHVLQSSTNPFSNKGGSIQWRGAGHRGERDGLSLYGGLCCVAPSAVHGQSSSPGRRLVLRSWRNSVINGEFCDLLHNFNHIQLFSWHRADQDYRPLGTLITWSHLGLQFSIRITVLKKKSGR